MWEIASRVIKCVYEAPYAEYSEIKMVGIFIKLLKLQDFQIAIAASEKGIRPTTPAICPPPWADLIKRCVEHNPVDRPTTAEMLKELEAMQQVYYKFE